MTESQAYEVAVAHLEKLGATFHRCYSWGCDSNYEMRPGSLSEPDLPKGPRNKVWSFAFQFEEYPPEVVVSGNSCVVSVDDETGLCSYWVSL